MRFIPSAVGRRWWLVFPMLFFTVSNSTAVPLDFEELRALIQTNLPGVTRTEIEQKAAEGLLQGFRGKVQLNDSTAGAPTNSEVITRSVVLDGGVAHLRISRVTESLSQDLRRYCEALDATNKLKGVALDLRFATGDDYAAAAAAADLFVEDECDLLDYGTGIIKSVAKTNALPWPVVVLVNGETTGAAEALAALLRETGKGLILGSPTIGAAMTAKEFSLATGQRLRIAAAPVKLGNGVALPVTGVKPDILVSVTLAEERTYWNDPYGNALYGTATNTVTGVTNRPVRRTRTNEADLVRARREGLDLNDEAARAREPEPEVPVIRDPALGRAVDLLKGLAVVRRNP